MTNARGSFTFVGPTLAFAQALQAELLRGLRLRHACDSCKPSIAIGISRRAGEYILALRVQDEALLGSPPLDSIIARAHGEVDVRYIGIVRPLVSSETPHVGAPSGSPSSPGSGVPYPVQVTGEIPPL